MRSFEFTLIGISISEEKALADLWLAMDEIKAKVVYVLQALPLTYRQQSLDFSVDNNEDE